MKERAFRAGMWILVVVGIGSTIATVFFTNPYQDIELAKKNFLNVAILYLSLSVFFTGLFSLLFYWLRRKANSNNDEQHVNMGVSFRQGLLLSIALVLVMVLQSFRILVWWDALLAIGTVMMVELYFLAR